MIDYRPISLCNIVAKTIGKVIINRWRSVLVGIISEYQSAFLPEGLSCMLREAEMKRTLTGVKISRDCSSITHILFADDTMLFCRANRSESREVLRILGDYEEASGQKINIAKSSVNFDTITGPSTKREVVELLGMKEVADHGKYLGLPSHIGLTKKEVFNFLVSRMEDKMEKCCLKRAKRFRLNLLLRRFPLLS
ncbi:hypothetical protein LIER_07477 [Lithospermum erythrorhizon]|uniref:Reverse transcriptase domain-containing protein n=1 Tax=Lithospermum erythrorhizon TaxID=34254 RepID=A0AAV3PCX4_LITER